MVFCLRFRRVALATLSVCSALLFGAQSHEAMAAIVYDNGLPTIGDGGEVTEYVLANDFTLASATSVTGGAIYIVGVGGIGSWDGTFDYWLFANTTGNSPGAVLASGSATGVSTTSIGPQNWTLGGDVFRIDFNLASPFSAAAGTNYWLGVHLSTNYNRDNIYWVRTPLTAAQGSRNYYSQGGTFNNWTSPFAEQAFYLNGVPAGGAVPEPTSLAIFGLGALGAACRARRRSFLA